MSSRGRRRLYPPPDRYAVASPGRVFRAETLSPTPEGAVERFVRMRCPHDELVKKPGGVRTAWAESEATGYRLVRIETLTATPLDLTERRLTEEGER